MKFIAPEQVIIYFIDIVFLSYLLLIWKTSFEMVTKFDFNSSTSYQYNLEKKNILISTIVSFFIVIKVLLLFFFTYFIDSLSSSIPGAMCAVGVLNSTPYGAYLIVLKIVIIFMLGYWYYINKFDLKNYGFKFTKIKYFLLIFITFLIIVEFLLEKNLFDSISPQKIVSCCGSVFNGEIRRFNTFLFDIKDNLSVILLLSIFALVIIAYLLKKYLFYGILSIIFIFIALYSLIDFFSTYIYQLPTHRCPFCVLQKDYHYIGYILYFFLFFGVFYGSSQFILYNVTDISTKNRWINISFIYFCIYVAMIFYYVLSYYLINGAWLRG